MKNPDPNRLGKAEPDGGLIVPLAVGFRNHPDIIDKIVATINCSYLDAIRLARIVNNNQHLFQEAPKCPPR
jgi:3-polyprenyl-4-hydroxybenzoate decarboxylase